MLINLAIGWACIYHLSLFILDFRQIRYFLHRRYYMTYIDRCIIINIDSYKVWATYRLAIERQIYRHKVHRHLYLSVEYPYVVLISRIWNLHARATVEYTETYPINL